MMGQEARIPPTGVDFLIPHPRLTNGISINATKWYAVYSRSHYHSKLNNSKTTGYRFVHSTSGAWNLQRYTSIHIPFQKASTKSVLTKKNVQPFLEEQKIPRIQETNGPSPQWIPPATSKRHTLRRWWSSFPWSPAARWVTHQQMNHPPNQTAGPPENGWPLGSLEISNLETPSYFRWTLLNFRGVLDIPWNTGCLISILRMEYYNPHIVG